MDNWKSSNFFTTEVQLIKTSCLNLALITLQLHISAPMCQQWGHAGQPQPH